MHPKDLSIRNFTYHLPEEKIARYPLSVRDESKLLIFKNKIITDDIYLNLNTYVPEHYLLVFNNTKVVEARILFQKSTGGFIEIFCLEPEDSFADITSAMLQKERVVWKCLVGGAKKWKADTILTNIISGGTIKTVLKARQIEKCNDYFLIEFSWSDTHCSFAEILHVAGIIPLPPYLNRNAEEADKNTYQTIYAKNDGSVAAPTAGLHFTERIFQKLKTKNVQHDFVTLHVGAGTFKPVKTETMETHEMHAEFMDVSLELIQNLIEHLNSGIIAVGTTSLRTIESLYWMGLKIKLNADIDPQDLVVKQWEAYEIESQAINAKEALLVLKEWMIKNQLNRLITKTRIIIAPGYNLRIAKALITNFHQPQSTLLLLIAAILGDEWKTMYNYALQHDYRFLSYGDGCLIWPDAI